jgi:hypothetical protein
MYANRPLVAGEGAMTAVSRIYGNIGFSGLWNGRKSGQSKHLHEPLETGQSAEHHNTDRQTIP